MVRSRKVAVSPEVKLYMLTDDGDGKLIRIRNQKFYLFWKVKHLNKIPVSNSMHERLFG